MQHCNKITPEHCANMEEIRAEIDLLDKNIIAMLGKRFDYVKAAATFKTFETFETSVRAPARFDSMLQQRRSWALAVGLNPDAIEKMYRDLVNHFIDEEMVRWQLESRQS
jgi:isochorismate pyruvate lyase